MKPYCHFSKGAEHNTHIHSHTHTLAPHTQSVNHWVDGFHRRKSRGLGDWSPPQSFHPSSIFSTHSYYF